MAKTKKKNYLIILLFVLLISITVGYAAFSQNLTITGTATANGNFELKFDTASVDPEHLVGVQSGNYSATLNETKDTLSIGMTLDYPGASGVINATIKNTGSVPAKLEDIEFTNFTNDTGDNDIKVTYTGPDLNSEIQPNGTTPVTITIKWDENSTQPNKTLNFNATLKYAQSTNN